jgi:hypothetical protein
MSLSSDLRFGMVRRVEVPTLLQDIQKSGHENQKNYKETGYIHKNYDDFLHAFENKTINCDENGNFYEEWLVVRVFRWLFSSLEDSRLNNIATVFTQKLRDLEVTAPVKTIDGKITFKDKYEGYIKVGNAITNRLALRVSESTKVARQTLERNLIALEYRTEIT